LVSVLVVIVGVYEISAGNLTTGGLVAASLLSSRAMAPLAQLASLLVRLHSSFMSLRSLDKVMKTPLERPKGKTFLHRPHRLGQEHAGAAADGPLHAQFRRHSGRRYRSASGRSRGSAAQYRLCAARRIPFLRLGARQHRAILAECVA